MGFPRHNLSFLYHNSKVPSQVTRVTSQKKLNAKWGVVGGVNSILLINKKNSYQIEVLVDVSIQPVMYYHIPCTIVIGIRI